MNPTQDAKTKIELVRAEARRQARDRLLGEGVSIDSPKMLEGMDAAERFAVDMSIKQRSQRSLKQLYDAKIGGVTMIENEDDIAQMGGAFVASDPNVQDWIDLRADQIEKGISPIKWSVFTENKRGAAVSGWENLLGGVITGLEGMASSWAEGFGRAAIEYGAEIYDPTGLNLAEVWDSLDPNMQQKIVTGLGEAAREQARGVTGYMIGSDRVAELVGSDPNAPVMKSEMVGEGGSRGGIGRAISGQMTDVGAAVSSMPMSVPPMVGAAIGGHVGQAVASIPFAFMGYGDGARARWDIYDEQVRMAEELGINPPPMPSWGEVETWGAIGGAFEFGSEYLGDMFQFGMAKTAFGKTIGGRFGKSKIGTKMADLADSLQRMRGWRKYAFGAPVTVAAMGVSEGIEETVPSIGSEVQDIIGWANNPEVWSQFKSDRDFFSAETLHNAKIGSIAGALFGGSVSTTAAAARGYQNRQTRKALEQGGAASMAGSMQMGQQADALTKMRRMMLNARGSVMAMRQVEQLGNDERVAMFVHEDDVANTLTKDVRERMDALGIPTKHIGTIKGTGIRVYAKASEAANVQSQFLNMQSVDEIAEMSGTLPMDADQPILGALVARNSAGQIVEFAPYSDARFAELMVPSMTVEAQKENLTVENIEAQDLTMVNDQIQRQIDADAAVRGLEPQAARPERPNNIRRGVAAIKADIKRAASGSKRPKKTANGRIQRPKASNPFKSKYLTEKEIGGATNGDVTVSVVLDRVSDDNLSEGERKIARTVRGSNATILDGKIVFQFADGRTIEKPIPMDGAFVSQASPDGIYLIRENGTAFTARNAFAIAMHEMRHRTLSRSRAGAQYLMRLLRIDPVYAVRGGANYMRNIDPSVARMSDAQMVRHFQGMQQAAMRVLADPASSPSRVAEAQSQMAQARRFAEESVTTTANTAFDKIVEAAASWDAIYKDSHERSLRAFSSWMANALVKNNFAGPEARQALFEIRQRIEGVREEEIKIHDAYRQRVEQQTFEDLEQFKQQQRKALGNAQVPTAQGTPQAAPSIREGAMGVAAGATTPLAALGGGDDEETQAQPAGFGGSPAARAAGLLMSAAMGQTAVVKPPTSVPTDRRQIPQESRDLPIPQESRDLPAAAQPAAPETAPVSEIEDFARRQRNAANAMRIIEGGRPTEPVDVGTVQRIQRTRVLTQTPSEETMFSQRRVGRRDANEGIRSLRDGFMSDRGIEPETDMREQYADVDEDFAKRVADWFESTPVDYNDARMREAYAQFGQETLDQYNYLRDQGYEMVPWGGKGQPYADSADMLEDLRENKRLFYYKTVNPDEAASFGSDPAKFEEAFKKNPLIADVGIEVLDSEGVPYRQTYNDLFRAVHDIFGHGAEGFQFGPRGEENAYRSHAVMFSPLARSAMATETRGQNSWVNYGPNRRNPDGSVWGESDPRYKPWLERLKNGEGYADQKPLLMPVELQALYSQREQPEAAEAPALSVIDLGEYENSLPKLPRAVTTRHMKSISDRIKDLESDEYEAGSFVVTAVPSQTSVNTSETLGFRPYLTGAAIETMDTYQPQYRIENPKVGDTIAGEYKIVAIKNRKPSAPSPQPSVQFSQRETPDAVSARQAADVERKRAVKNLERARRSESAPRVAISTAVTETPMVPKHVFVPRLAQDPTFDRAAAFASADARIKDVLVGGEMSDAIKAASGKDVRISDASMTARRGFFNGQLEDSFTIDLNGLGKDQAHSIAKILGSLFLQKAVITVSEIDASTPNERVAMVAQFTTKDGSALSASDMDDLLKAVGQALGGASSNATMDGAHSFYVQGVTGGTIEDWFKNASAIANARGLDLGWDTVDSNYTESSEYGVPEAMRGRGGKPRRGKNVKGSTDWGAWVKPAASVVEILRDEGFDIDIDGWLGEVSGGDAEAKQRLKSELTDELAERASGGRYGLDARYLTTYDGNMQGLSGKPKVPASVTDKNAPVVFKAVNDLIARHPNLLSSIEAYKRFLADMFGSRIIPMVPKDLLSRVADGFALTRKRMNLIENGGILTPRQISDAVHGLEMARHLHSLYKAGKAEVKHTVALAMWGFMSRGVSPMVQEGLFLDLYNYTDAQGRNLQYFVDKMLNGTFTDAQVVGYTVTVDGKKVRALPATATAEERKALKAELEAGIPIRKWPKRKGKPQSPVKIRANKAGGTVNEWTSWVSSMFEKTGYPEIDEDGNLVRDADGNISRVNGSVGAGATHNANAFGRTFLLRMGRMVTIDGKRLPAIAHFHNEMSNPKASASSIRQVFLTLGSGMGIGNKVVSFLSLVTGHFDGVVNDRVRIGDTYNSDGSLGNVYDGSLTGYTVYLNDKPHSVLAAGTTKAERESAVAKIRQDAIDAQVARGVKKPRAKVGIEEDRVGGLAGLFDGPRGHALYLGVERNMDPTQVFADLVKSNPEVIPFVSMGLLHWLEWVGVSNQEASHKTMEALARSIENASSMVGVYAKEGQYDVYAYGVEYGYENDADGNPQPRYVYPIGNRRYEFSPRDWHAFLAQIPSVVPKGFKVTKNADGTKRVKPWYEDPRVGADGIARMQAMADQMQTKFSMRSERNTVDRSIAEIVGGDELAKRHEVRRGDFVVARSNRDIADLIRDMVFRAYPKPSFGANADVWLVNNPMMNIAPHDGLWMHGTKRNYTEPRYESIQSFGFHVGSVFQSLEFLKNESDDAGTVGLNNLFPAYIRSRNPMLLPDLGTWYPNGVIEAAHSMGYIDSSARNAYYDEFTDVQSRANIAEDPLAALDLDSATLEEYKAEAKRIKEIQMQIAWRTVEAAGFDGIIYTNGGEGRSFYTTFSKTLINDSEILSRLRETTSESTVQEWLGEYDRQRRDLDIQMGEALRKGGYNLNQSRLIPDFQRMYADLPLHRAAIVWNRGSVKSPTARMFDPLNNDMRYSMRDSDISISSRYPMLFNRPTEASFSMRNGLQGRSDEALVRFVDKYGELLREQREIEVRTGGSLADNANPYLGARILTGRLAALQQQAESNYAMILRDMHLNGVSVVEMDEFLTAQHALNGGNAYIASIGGPADGGTGMTNAEARDVINRHNASGRFGTMNRIADDWRAMLRESLDNRRDAGLISRDLHTTLTTRYTHYVPLRGTPARPFDELFEEYDGGTPFGGGLSTQGRGMPRRYGRVSRAQGVTSQIGFVHEDALRRIARNDIGQRLLNLTLIANDPSFAEVVRLTRPVVVEDPITGVRETRQIADDSWRDDERHFGLYINRDARINGHRYQSGDLIVIRINNPRVAKGLLNPSVPLRSVEGALNAANNVFRFMTTGLGNPVFPIFNTVRDVIQGSLNNYAARGVADTALMLAKWPSAFWNVMSDAWLRPNGPTGWNQQFVNAGGDQLYWRQNDLEQKSADFNAIAERVARRDPNDRGIARTLLGWYPSFFSAAEKATRVAQYRQRIDTGATPEQAALAARDITVDFAKGGTNTRVLNTWYLFFNASIQGTANTMRALRQAPELAPALVMLGIVQGVMGRLFGGDDEEMGGKRWDTRVSDDDKARSLYFFDPSGSGKAITVPMSYGYNTLVAAGVHLADTVFGPKTAGEMSAAIVADALNSFNPMTGSGITTGYSGVASAALPTVARPAAELWANRNYANRQIAPQSFERNGVRSEQFFDNTPNGYVEVARALNAAFGGDEFTSSGAFTDISPNQLQYLVGYYLSGSGRLVDRLYSNAVSDTPVTVNDIPLVRGFVKNIATDDRQITQQYYDIGADVAPELRKMQIIAQAVKGDADPMQAERAFLTMDEEKAEVGKAFKAVDKKLQKLRELMKRATTPEERAALIEERKRLMKSVIRERNLLRDSEPAS